MLLILTISVYIAVCSSSSSLHVDPSQVGESEGLNNVANTNNAELFHTQHDTNLSKKERTKSTLNPSESFVSNMETKNPGYEISHLNIVPNNLIARERRGAIVNVLKDGHRSVSYIIHPDNLPSPNFQPLKDLITSKDASSDLKTGKVASSEKNIFKIIPAVSSGTDIYGSASSENSHSEQIDFETGVPKSEDQFDILSYHEEPAHTSINPEEDSPLLHHDEYPDLIKTVIENYIYDKSNPSRLEHPENYFPEMGKIYSNTTEPKSDLEMFEADSKNDDNSSSEDITYSYFIPKHKEDDAELYNHVKFLLSDLANSNSAQNMQAKDLLTKLDNLDPNALKLILNMLILPSLEVDRNTEDRNSDKETPGSVSLTPDFLAQTNSFKDYNGSQPRDFWNSMSRSPEAPDLLKSSNVDVITVKPGSEIFEVVLQSSFQHEPEVPQRPAKRLPIFNQKFTSNEIPVRPKTLRLGLNIPPPEALAALPRGSILIPPSQVVGKPSIPSLPSLPSSPPKISSEPLPDFLSKISVFEQPKPQETPSKSKFQSINSLLSSLFKTFYKTPKILLKPPPPPPSPKLRISPPQKRLLYAPMNQEEMQINVSHLPLKPPPPVFKTTSYQYPRREAFSPPVKEELNHYHDIFSGYKPLSYSQVTRQVMDEPQNSEAYKHPPIFNHDDGNDNATLYQTRYSTQMDSLKRDFYASYDEDVGENSHVKSVPDDVYNSHMYKVDEPENHEVLTTEKIPDSYFYDYEDYETGEDNKFDVNVPRDSEPLESNIDYAQPPSYDIIPMRAEILNIVTTPYSIPSPASAYTNDGHSASVVDEDKDFPVPPEIRNFAYLHKSYAYPYDDKEEIKTYSNPVSVGQIWSNYSKDDSSLSESSPSRSEINSHEYEFVQAFDNIPDFGYRNNFDSHEEHEVDVFSSEHDDSYFHDSNFSTINFSNFRLNKTLDVSEDLNYEAQEKSENDHDLKLTQFTSADILQNDNIVRSPNIGPVDVPEGTIIPKEDFEKALNRQKYKNKFRRPQEENLNSLFAFPSLVNEGDTSVANLWNDMKLIPLEKEIPPPEEEFSSNIAEFEKNFENFEERNSSNRKKSAMAYILIGACVGLACLSIIGVFIIVRFKKTCGSREIGKSSYFGKRGAIRELSRLHTHGEKAGHKLGSWFTGRNEQLGPGKLRSNMALPDVKNKMSKSNSTRDLLSISSASSQNSTSKQSQRSNSSSEGMKRSPRDDREKPSLNSTRFSGRHQTSSWLHEEFYPKSDDSDYKKVALKFSKGIDDNLSTTSYQTRAESSKDFYGKTASYVHSLDCEDIDGTTIITSNYPTDSEMEDASYVTRDSKDIEDVKASKMSRRFRSMGSQELGEELSRDLKVFQYGDNDVDGSLASRGERYPRTAHSFTRDNVQSEVFLEFDNMLRQHTSAKSPLPTTITDLTLTRPDSQYSTDKDIVPGPPPRPPKPSRFSSSTALPNNGRARAQTPTRVEDSQSWTSKDEDRLI